MRRVSIWSPTGISKKLKMQTLILKTYTVQIFYIKFNEFLAVLITTLSCDYFKYILLILLLLSY